MCIRDSRSTGLCHRPAVLPEVFADRDGHVDVTDTHNGEVPARGEDPELVEHAVVGQVVLCITSLDLAVVQHRGAVLGEWSGDLTGRPGREVWRAAQVADNDREVAETVRGEVGGKLEERRSRRVDERGP